MKVKNALVEKLDFESAPEIERAHCTGRARRQDGTPKPQTVVCKFTSYKAKKARRIKPEGLNIFEHLAEETIMGKRRVQLPQLKQAKGKHAYFSLDKLIIRDRPANGSNNGFNTDLFTLYDNR